MPYVQRTAYAEVNDLIALGVPAAVIGSLAPEVVQLALCAASDTVDNHLRNQYVTPLTEWAYDVRLHVCALAAYTIMATVGYNPEGSDSVFRSRRDDAMEWLRDLGSNRASLAGGIKLGPRVMGGPIINTQPRRNW